MKSEIDTNQIADSGSRREFETGAVRDICEGKGRCDLLPLDVLGDIYERMIPEEPDICTIFSQIEQFREDGNTSHLVFALASFIEYYNYSLLNIIITVDGLKCSSNWLYISRWAQQNTAKTTGGAGFRCIAT